MARRSIKHRTAVDRVAEGLGLAMPATFFETFD
jgi:hypothetical protein